MVLNVCAFASALKSVSGESQQRAESGFYKDRAALCRLVAQVKDLAGSAVFRPLEVGHSRWVQRANRIRGCQIKRGDLMSGSSATSCL